MTNRYLSLVFLLFAGIPSFGQGITKQDADSMLTALNKGSTGIDRVHLLLRMAQYHIHKPGENKVDFDSATACINEAAKLNKSVRSPTAEGYQALVESYLALERGERGISKTLVEKAIPLLEKGDNKSFLGKAYYQLSEFYDYKTLEQLSPKIALIEKALNAFDQAGDIGQKAACHKMLGDLYNIQGDDEKAIAMTKLALAEYESINYKEMQSVYALLGAMYRSHDDYGLALHYELKALKTAESSLDTTMQLCQINAVLGGIYSDLERYDLAIKYFKDALKIAERYEDRYSVFLLMLNIINTSIPNNPSSPQQPQQAISFLSSMPSKYTTPESELEEYYLALAYCKVYVAAKQLNKARPYCNTLMKLADSRTLLDDAKNNINRVVASYFLATQQYSTARIYLERNKITSAHFTGSLRTALDSRWWYKVDSAQGNYQSAFKHFIIYKTITDSLFNVTKSRQLQQIEVEYETAKKEDSLKLQNRDITLLKNIQQANLTKIRVIKNATIAGIALALVIIGLLYRQYRHKQKSNEVISTKNGLLQHLLTEKEWLLKEIHHRVKNNLQIVMSLLNSQSAYIDNEPALTAIHDSQHRVHAMSLIHQKLYSSDNVSSIDMSFYIRELVSYLSDSFNTGQRIRFEFSIEPLEMDVSHAVPLGLILNEAITNAIKYAFPGDRDGLITISLLKTAPYHYLLSISDNGIGMPPRVNNKKPGSLGMSLMAGLSEDLDGIFSIENKNGTAINLAFVYDLGVRKSGPFPTSIVSNN